MLELWVKGKGEKRGSIKGRKLGVELVSIISEIQRTGVFMEEGNEQTRIEAEAIQPLQKKPGEISQNWRH